MLGLTGGALGAGLGIIGAIFLPGVVGDPITISAWAMAGAPSWSPWPSASSSGSTRRAGPPTWPPSTLCGANSTRQQRGTPHADTDQPKLYPTALGTTPRHGRARPRGRRPHAPAPSRRRRDRRRPTRPIRCQRQRGRPAGDDHGGAERQRRARPRSTGPTTTTFTQTVTETVSSLAVGDCVTVTGTPSKKSKTTIAARSITIQPPRRRARARSLARRAAPSGFGGGFGGGGFPAAAGLPPAERQLGTRDEAERSRRVRHAASPAAGSFAIASGKVTASAARRSR